MSARKLNSLYRVLSALLLGILLLSTAVAGKVRLVIDTEDARLTVLEEGAVIEEFDGIAIGRFGTTHYKQRGDNKTPLGTYRIGWITQNTRYHRFLGFDFPDLKTASRGMFDGRIDKAQWLQIRRDIRAGKTPSQQTPLGGYLGIHGIGAGDIEVHRQLNWTNGCVALTNEQVDRLVEWVKVGTEVEIR
jgi:murein L,D-transpeptidase YafK